MNVTAPKTSSSARTTAATTTAAATTAPTAAPPAAKPHHRGILEATGMHALVRLAAAALPESKAEGFDYNAAVANEQDAEGSMAKIGHAVRKATGTRDLSLDNIGKAIRHAVSPKSDH